MAYIVLEGIFLSSALQNAAFTKFHDLPVTALFNLHASGPAPVLTRACWEL